MKNIKIKQTREGRPIFTDQPTEQKQQTYEYTYLELYMYLSVL